LFSISVQPYLRHLKRLVRGPGTLESVTFKKEVLCAEEPATYSPAIYLAGQLERITNSPVESTKEIEIAAATTLSDTHPPTLAYHLSNAVLVDGSVYVGNLRHFLTDRRQQAGRPIDAGSYENCGLVSSYYGVKYFGHWLRDDCATHLLASALGIPPLFLPIPASPHEKQYRSLFDHTDPPAVLAWIEHLVVFDDMAHNSLRLKRYEALRETVARHFPRKHHQRLVYLKRGKSGQRRVLQNEEDLIEVLTKQGFVVVDVENDDLKTIIATLVDAKLVVSIEGSHIAHCTFAVPRDSALLVLQPPDRFAANHRKWANCLGVRFGFVVGSVGQHGYIFDPVEVARTVDLMMSVIR
jgi:capsular polysaccharide biosynthesis protein